MEYVVAFLYAFTWPLVTLDALSWMVLPWPQCGFGAWIGPAALVLAQHTMVQEKAPLRAVIVGRWVALVAAAIQGWLLLQRGLENINGLPW